MNIIKAIVETLCTVVGTVIDFLDFKKKPKTGKGPKKKHKKARKHKKRKHKKCHR